MGLASFGNDAEEKVQGGERQEEDHRFFLLARNAIDRSTALRDTSDRTVAETTLPSAVST
jgi:hypothetical protein